MTLVRERGRPAQRSQVFEAPINRSNDGDHKDPLGSNKPGPSEALEAPIGPPKTPLPTLPAPDIVRYTQKDINYLLQTFFQASKGRSWDKLKSKTPDVYRSRSYMECYNFCQQCEDHFTTCEATRPNRISFAASFLRDRINFYWQQHKRKVEAESLIPISWDEFKAFL